MMLLKSPTIKLISLWNCGLFNSVKFIQKDLFSDHLLITREYIPKRATVGVILYFFEISLKVFQASVENLKL